MKAKKFVPSEEHEQMQIFRWASENIGCYPGLDMLHGSMSGIRLAPGLRMKAKKLGNPKGYPDISLPVRSGKYSGLYIELKRRSKCKVSPEQRTWLKRLNAEGFLAVVAKGSDEAIEIIKDYLMGKGKRIKTLREIPAPVQCVMCKKEFIEGRMACLNGMCICERCVMGLAMNDLVSVV